MANRPRGVPRESANVSKGILRCSDFKKHINVVPGLLIPPGGIGLDLEVQVWVPLLKLCQEWGEDIARHRDRAYDLQGSAWTDSSDFKLRASLAQRSQSSLTGNYILLTIVGQR